MNTKVAVEKATKIHELQNKVNDRIHALESTGNVICGNVALLYDKKYIAMITYRRRPCEEVHINVSSRGQGRSYLSDS